MKNWRNIIQKIIVKVNRFLNFIFFLSGVLLSFWVFINGYSSYRRDYGNIADLEIRVESIPSGYIIAKEVLDDWQILRNFFFLLTIPAVVLFAILFLSFVLKKKYLRAIKGCLSWLFVLLLFVFSFAIGAQFLDVIIIMNNM